MREPLRIAHSAHLTEAGCDEAGRGCLAGPVVAAAVILPRDFHHPLLNDSKQLSARQRELLRPVIEREALSWSVSFIGPEEIDRINILQASITGMHRALEGLSSSPQLILVDGNRFNPFREIPHLCVIKGDSLYASIAAASVLAKSHRDEFMCQLSNAFPEYRWEKNMGYPTRDHREAIRLHGPTLHHRMTFKLLPEQLELAFDTHDKES